MQSMGQASSYKSYILRVWQVERGAHPMLAVILEDCETGAQQAFPGLAALVEFLETGKVPAPSLCDSEAEEGVY